jgi:hypothetical protein
VHLHSLKKIKALCKNNGLKLVEYRGRFLFSAIIYRVLPFPIVKMLGFIEGIFPKSFLNRRYYVLRKT